MAIAIAKFLLDAFSQVRHGAENLENHVMASAMPEFPGKPCDGNCHAGFYVGPSAVYLCRWDAWTGQDRIDVGESVEARWDAPERAREVRIRYLWTDQGKRRSFHRYRCDTYIFLIETVT
jgi:hypothetical protein